MYLFALFLVLYEFTTYSANDMIMPGMIQVVNDFHAPQYFVALSMSLYILGNAAFLLLAGYFAEKYGKRRVIIIGNLLFFAFTVAELFSRNIHEFMVWRFLQGSGMTIIAIGYAIIHENFNDKAAIKLAALMGNVSLLAPLLGPAMGSAILSYSSWEYIFGVSAVLSLVTFIGLYQFTPHSKLSTSFISLKDTFKQYGIILKNKEFFHGTMCLVISLMSLLIWISQAPNLILYKLHESYLDYALYQLVSIGGLSLSSIGMQYIVGRYSLYSIVKTGNILAILGLLGALVGSQSIHFVVVGLFFYTFGIGLSNGCIMRLIMSIKGYSQGMLASMLSFIEAILFVVGITLTNIYFSHFHYSLLSFTMMTFLFGLIAFIWTVKFMVSYRDRGWQ